MEMFEQASYLALRFATPMGQLATEDLWRLPLDARARAANLDDIAIGLARQIRESADVVSFVTPSATDADKVELNLKFAIVKHIIEVRVAARDEATAAADRRDKKNRILELVAKKRDQELEGKSVDELLSLAQSL